MYVAICAVIIIIVGLVCFFSGVSYRKKTAESKLGSAEKESKRIVDEAVLVAEAKKNEIILKGQSEIQEQKSSLEKEILERRKELNDREKSVRHKDESLEKKSDMLEKKQNELKKKEIFVEERVKDLEVIKKKHIEKLEKVAVLTKEEAKRQLLELLDGELSHEKAVKILENEKVIREDSKKKAREIISLSIQRCAVDSVSETTVSVVSLPNEDMKGRIIGREGRNIRTIETLTGVDLVIDDTPEAITLSCFDPIRREVARIALENLILDGRIHPAKIEESIEKAKRQLDEIIKEEGEKALIEANVTLLEVELIKLLGKLKYRTSYGQNVLKHSVEVAQICGIIACEVDISPLIARRAGLLHDIGKALDHTVEGSHVDIGVDVLKRYKESEEIIHAVKAHHGGEEHNTALSFIVQAADAISAARPGARRENIENYIKRLEELEKIATSFKGVGKCFAVQAGREVRIMVEPDKVTDEEMIVLSRNICKKIETELNYPGRVRVTLIRESRAVEYAR